jgi:hypothetical protein
VSDSKDAAEAKDRAEGLSGIGRMQGPAVCREEVSSLTLVLEHA